MEIEYIFKSTDESAMVEGCKFFGGLYMTKDPLRAESLRHSKLFNHTITEITKEIETIQKHETITPAVKPVIRNPVKPKPKSKSKK